MQNTYFSLYLVPSGATSAHLDLNCINTTFAACVNAARTLLADNTITGPDSAVEFCIVPTGNAGNPVSMPRLTPAANYIKAEAKCILIRSDFYSTELHPDYNPALDF